MFKSRFSLPLSVSFFLFLSVSTTLLLVIYWPGLKGPFLLDDLPSIIPAQLNSFSWSKLLEITTSNQTGPLGRPLSVLTFALNHLFFGPEPFSYKLTNLLLHAMTGVAIAWLSYLILIPYRPRIKYRFLISCLLATIWLLHPLQVSTVLYVVQRMTLLSQFFVILSCGLYLQGRLKQLTYSSATPYFTMSGLCWVLGLAAKETAVLLPLYLYLIEYFILKFKLRSKISQRKFHSHAKLFLLCFIFLSLLCFWYYQDYFYQIYSEKPFSLVERVFTQLHAMIFYIKLIYTPSLAEMSLFHDDFTITHAIDHGLIIALLCILSLCLVIFLLRRKKTLIAFGLAWFFVSHLLESTILPLELVFEHRNYLACFGLILIPVVVLTEFLQQKEIRLKILYFSLSGLFVILMVNITWLRVHDWSSTEKFLLSAVLNKQKSPRTHIEFANWLLEKKAYPQAYEQLLQAQNIQPHNTGIDLHILLIHCHATDVPEHLYESAQRKLESYPITPYALLSLNQLVQNIYNQQCPVLDKNKITKIIQAGHKNPYLKHRPRYSAVLYHLEAGLMLLKNKPVDAKMLLMQSFEIYPRRLQPLITKATIELNQGDIENARRSVKILEQNQLKPYAPHDEINELKRRLYEYECAQSKG